MTPKPLGLNEFNVIYNNQYKILSEISLEYHKYTRMYKIEEILCMITKLLYIQTLDSNILRKSYFPVIDLSQPPTCCFVYHSSVSISVRSVH